MQYPWVAMWDELNRQQSQRKRVVDEILERLSILDRLDCDIARGLPKRPRMMEPGCVTMVAPQSTVGGGMDASTGAAAWASADAARASAEGAAGSGGQPNGALPHRPAANRRRPFCPSPQFLRRPAWMTDLQWQVFLLGCRLHSLSNANDDRS